MDAPRNIDLNSLVTYQDAADELRVNYSRIGQLVREGVLKVVKLNGRTPLVTRSSLEAEKQRRGLD